MFNFLKPGWEEYKLSCEAAVEMELLVYTFKTLIAQIWYQLVYFDDMLLAAWDLTKKVIPHTFEPLKGLFQFKIDQSMQKSV